MRQQWSVFEQNIRWRPWGYGATARTQALGWISIFSATALLLWILSDLWSLKQLQLVSVEQKADIQTRLEQLEAAASRKPKDVASSIDLNDETRQGFNRVIRHLNTPWPGVFDALERLTPRDVALIRIEPDANGVVMIEAESTDIDKLMSYADGLEDQGIFGAVSLRRHVTNERDPNRPARLVFLLALKEDGK